MASDTVLCQGCGITLRPFMQRCPRCGAEREAVPPAAPNAEVGPVPGPIATHFVAEPPPWEKPAPPPPPAVKPAVIAVDDVRRRALRQEVVPPPVLPPQDAIFVSPPDEVRRFPLFTRSQIVLMLVGLGLVLFGLLIGYLLWSREQKDAITLRSGGQNLPPPSFPMNVPPPVAPPLDLNETPTPALSVDDQALSEEARKVLVAYNPNGFARYKITVKDGVVTLNGEAAHQPEKEGATNVLRLLAGAKSVVNNLVVNTAIGMPTPALPPGGATPTPANTEANLSPPAAPLTVPAPAQPDPALLEAQRLQQQENERLQRELVAARQREAELQRQREAEEAAHQQQQDAARRAASVPATPPPAPTRSVIAEMRSGTVAWSGIVDGVDEVVITGGSAVVRHLSGGAVRDARASFSAAVPRAPVGVKLLSNSGRGSIQIVQEPATANGYTTIVRLDDSAHGGANLYQFTLRWARQ